jgi:hypothetical protein
MANIIILFGWVIIIAGTLALITFFYAPAKVIAETFSDESDAINNMALLLTFIATIVNIVIGISVISRGQLILVLLDIRKDVRFTARISRVMGMYLSEK